MDKEKSALECMLLQHFTIKEKDREIAKLRLQLQNMTSLAIERHFEIKRLKERLSKYEVL